MFQTLVIVSLLKIAGYAYPGPNGSFVIFVVEFIHKGISFQFFENLNF
jgi:hypothetical protein